MTVINVLKTLLLASAICFITGCPLEVIAPSGGDVVSLASGTCLEDNVCEIQINDTNFSESFTAKPKRGYAFVKWKAGDGFWCGDSIDPTCKISTVGLEGNAAAESIIASSNVARIKPVFHVVQRLSSGSINAALGEPLWYQRMQGNWVVFKLGVGSFRIGVYEKGCVDDAQRPNPVVSVWNLDSVPAIANIVRTGCEYPEGDAGFFFEVKTWRNGELTDLNFSFSFIDPTYPE